MLTDAMRQLIEENTVGLVATVTPDGAPAVSPKGTTVILDERTIAFGDIRSPQTVRNILCDVIDHLVFGDHRSGYVST